MEETGGRHRRRRLRWPRSWSSCCSRPPPAAPTAATPCARSSTTPATSSPARTSRSTGSRSGPWGRSRPRPQAQAAVVLHIENPGFQDFRADASCTIRPQALIGEKYVDCLPTQPRVEGTPLPPPLHKIPGGQEGAGRVPAAGAEHPQPGRRRPARRHQPPARTPAPDDHPQRTRRRPGRARQRPQRGRSAAPTRRCRNSTRCSRSSPARTTCSRNSPSTPTRRWPRSPGCASGSPTSSCRATRSRRPAPPPAAPWRATWSCSRRSSNSSGPAMERARSLRRTDHADVHRPQSRRARDSTRRSRACPAFSNSSEKFFESLGKTAKVSGPALVGDRDRCSNACSRSAAPRCRSRPTSPQLLTSLRETGGLERIMDFIFLGAELRQRLRRARATSCGPRASATAASHTPSRPRRTGLQRANCSAAAPPRAPAPRRARRRRSTRARRAW